MKWLRGSLQNFKNVLDYYYRIVITWIIIIIERKMNFQSDQKLQPLDFKAMEERLSGIK